MNDLTGTSEVDLNTLEWHDGTLDDVCIKGNGEVTVACYVYPTNDARVREKLAIRCVGVQSFMGTIDFNALLRNKFAGNINDGRFESPRRGIAVLKLFLSDGYIEVTAKKIVID